MKVRTLDGSKDVQGARREPKGRLSLNVLATGCPWLCGTDRSHKLYFLYSEKICHCIWCQVVAGVINK